MSPAKPSDTYLRALQRRYKCAPKKERSRILDEFVATTGYHRKHAIAVLRSRYVRVKPPIRRPRARIYTDEDKRAVWQIAEWFDEIDSQRLRAVMNVELPGLRKNGHLQVSPACYQRLHKISASTMHRLRVQRRVLGRRLRGGTKPGSLLKHQIPVRTFADWDDKRVGFVEIDLVQHDGGNASGIFACTLNVTDVCSGWTEMAAVVNKAQIHVFEALKHIRARLPFPLLGVDSDNGAEFINDELFRYCQLEQLTFTRGRAGRKNDNAFVEQKNYSVVRRLVGYDRFDTSRQVEHLNELYTSYRLYVNFFLPITKLVGKERDGRRVRKLYDEPQTPYQRLLDSPQVSQEVKAALRKTYARLDPVVLHRNLTRLNQALQASKFR